MSRLTGVRAAVMGHALGVPVDTKPHGFLRADDPRVVDALCSTPEAVTLDFEAAHADVATLVRRRARELHAKDPRRGWEFLQAIATVTKEGGNRG